MAFIRQDEEDKKNQTVGGEAPPTTGGGASGVSQGQAPVADGKTGFANLIQYLDANQGQGSQVADPITGKINADYGTIKGQVDTAAQGASDAVNAGKVKRDDSLINEAFSNPTGVANDENKYKEFVTERDATYKGPGSFEDTNFYGQAADAKNKAAEFTDIAKGPDATGKLIQKYTPNTTPGKLALDSSILNQDPNAVQSVKDATTPFAGINDLISGKSSEIKNAATAAKGEADALRGDISNRFNQTNADLTKQVTDRVAPAKESANKEIDLVGRALQAGSLKGFTPEEQALIAKYLNMDPGDDPANDLNAVDSMFSGRDILRGGFSAPIADTQKYGLTPIAGRDVDLSQFISSPSPDMITSANMATPEEYARAAALAKLAGSDSFGGLNPGDAEMAGTAPTDFSVFDVEGANGALDPITIRNIQQAKADYEMKKRGQPGVIGAL